ncbi:MAG: hypothetical protein DSY94_01055, partial [SAR324 cluster bacterium]
LLPFLFVSGACYEDPLWDPGSQRELDPAALADVVALLPHDEGVDEVALRYDLPPDLLIVMGWVGSSWSDPDPDHHRTVITFVGSPEAVEQAAGELAVMRQNS